MLYYFILSYKWKTKRTYRGKNNEINKTRNKPDKVKGKLKATGRSHTFMAA
jgi:hypothetical protein